MGQKLKVLRQTFVDLLFFFHSEKDVFVDRTDTSFGSQIKVRKWATGTLSPLRQWDDNEVECGRLGGVWVTQWLQRRSANPLRPWVRSPSVPTHFLSLILTAITGDCDSLCHAFWITFALQVWLTSGLEIYMASCAQAITSQSVWSVDLLL